MHSSRSLATGAMACMSLMAQPIAAMYYNASSPTSPTGSTPTFPLNSTGIANVPGWKYDGCEYDVAHFPGFNLVQGSGSMTVEICTGLCAPYKYAALLGSECYCGNNLTPTTTVFADASCNIQCPGNPAERCGGDLLSSKRSPSNKRDIVGSIVVSLYEQIVPPAGIVYTTVMTTTYMTLCPGATSLSPTALTTTLTLTHCGCTNPVVPTVPMTTIATTCGCGPAGAPSSVILTVPCTNSIHATAVGTVAPPKSTNVQFTGGAGRKEFAASVMMGAFGIAAALL